jgi:hypothetical protein
MCYGQIIAQAIHKATRKAHRCDWCGETIALGEQYSRQRVVFEGVPGSSRLHIECSAAARREASALDGECLYLEDDHKRGMTSDESRETEEET